MKYCGKCGQPNDDNAAFCGKCGHSFSSQTTASGFSEAGQEGAASGAEAPREASQTQRNNSSFVDSLNEYMGNTQPADLNWRVLFSDVFKPHTTEEAEDIFICGTKKTTPHQLEVSEEWPHPWLYSRVLLMFLIAFFFLWICVSQFSNLNALPGMIAVGSLAVPISTLILFLEANVWRNVSMYYVIKTFTLGGCASLVVTLFLFSFYSVEQLDFAGAFMVGVIEELGKAIIVLYFLKKLGKLSILTGLLVGASVGAGFAAFESAGYAFQPFIQFQQISGMAALLGENLDQVDIYDTINQTIFLRGVLAPGGHVAWTAIAGAAFVIAAKFKGAISFSLFTEAKFLRLFIIPIVLHGLWDSPLAAWGNGIFPFFGYIVLFVIVWIIVLILFNMGLSEVKCKL